MDSRSLARTLDDLAHAEQRSLIRRLHESTLFVSWVSARESEAVEQMIRQEQEHVAWLVALISDLGESPTPCVQDMDSTNIHFLELNYLMPRVIENKRATLKMYERAAPLVSESREAAALVGRILERHREHLATLERFSQQLKAA